MVICKKYAIEDYYNYLRNDKAEQDYLFNDLLIPVTYFFRDSDVFDSLPHLVFSDIIQNTVNNTVRIWAAGCATGQEAYSLAICIHEYLVQKNLPDIKVQIFASDISEKSIAKARTATYSAQEVQQIGETRLQKYFTKRDGQYHVHKVIRDMCIFATHNLITDPPFAKIDLICCRNVLVYFDAFLQNKILNYFHYALNEKDSYFLGNQKQLLMDTIYLRLPGKMKKSMPLKMFRADLASPLKLQKVTQKTK